MRKLGMVVFSSYTGLGNQSRRLTQLLGPERIMLINNSSFSKNREQHKEWYDGFTGLEVNGFPNRQDVNMFLRGLTHLYIIENPLNWDLIGIAKANKIKTFIASNYEFCDNLDKPHLPLPDMFLMPSHWKVAEMKQRFGDDKVKYLPPPVYLEDFTKAREANWDRKGRKKFLHIVGTLAAGDRNGTLILLESMKHSTADFDLVIRSQHELPPEYTTTDRRVKFQYGSQPEVEDMYTDFDAMIMPRRFGGLCLPMQEALMAGLPVIMPDISPNQEVLPAKWLVRAMHTGTMITRAIIDLYSPSPEDLAEKIDEMATRDIEVDKIDAFDIATRNYTPSVLREEYEKLW